MQNRLTFHQQRPLSFGKLTDNYLQVNFMENLILWIWLSEKCLPDTPTFSILYHTFGTVEDIYNSSREELEQVFGLKKTQIDALCDKNTQNAQSILKVCRMNNIGILPYNDELFPS